jgi:hypothetical protein
LAGAGADAREQGKGRSDGPLAAVRFGLEAAAAPSLTRRCPLLRLGREAATHDDGLPGKPQLLMPERLPELLEKYY